MLKRIALVLAVMGSSLFTSGCVQELWDAYLQGVASYITATTTDLLETFLPF